LQKSIAIIIGIISIIAAVAVGIISWLSTPHEIINPVMVFTDKSYYDAEKPTAVVVTYNVNEQVYKAGEILRLEIVNENRTVYTFREIKDVRPDRNMTEPISFGGEAALAGEYWVIASYRGFDAQTSFEYEGYKPPAPSPSRVECQPLALCTYHVELAGSTYPINFRMNGTIESMIANVETVSLSIQLTVERSGSLQVAIPRDLIESYSDEYAVFVNDLPVEYDEIPIQAREWNKVMGISEQPEKYRILIIPIPKGISEIEIIGDKLI
jgi:hypothetical protein